MKSNLRKINLLVVILTFITTSLLYAQFYENPVYFTSGNNTLMFTIKIPQQSDWELGVYWRQRQGTLFGELGYTTDSTYATGTINYRLVDISKLYGLNLKLKLLPFDAKALSLDVGGLIKISDSSSLSFAIYNLMLYSERQERLLPSMESVFGWSVTPQTTLKFGLMNLGLDYLKFNLGFVLSKLLPLDEVVLSYVPVYALSGGMIYHLVYGKMKLLIDNYIIEVSGFYNFGESVSTYEELKSNYGLKISLGFNM
ncbi:hypothetical protein SAMN04488510_1054 [Fervidobacterium changbaicum]|uniref:Uncharacterized protein n=2 Tax=Fervidobacterium TaxID=2422 RepID=A0AAI8GDA3_FERIS|nr:MULTISPECIES: hypothetical protein [Fervidobacterium]AMW33060.1 hypothetical protein NA23_07250 [Fervidobacterium islandicum]QAV33104.1 hypothetical protein CBS1_04735 [Fervidobacterium changbaicum]SDH10274.1 hypothetical protein SAMN04488510_1054 [Fervidobacterium changbaicum]